MNLETYILTSDYGSKPLAAIRVVGDKYELTLDNTMGKVDRLGQGSFSRLRTSVEKSSHMHLTEDDTPVPQYHRYLLNNGDVVEITADGKTAVLNGELLAEDAKNQLLDMLATNQIEVQHGRDDQPMTALPIVRQQKRKVVRNARKMDNGLLGGIEERRMEQDRVAKRCSIQYDPILEDAQFSTLDPEFTKTLGYGLKYNAFKGDGNGR